jgi:hypothetical protein
MRPYIRKLASYPGFYTANHRYQPPVRRGWLSATCLIQVVSVSGVVIALPFIVDSTLSMPQTPILPLGLLILGPVIYIALTIVLMHRAYQSIQYEKHNKTWELLCLAYENVYPLALGKWLRLLTGSIRTRLYATLLLMGSVLTADLIIAPYRFKENPLYVYGIAMMVFILSQLDFNTSITFGLLIALFDSSKSCVPIALIALRLVVTCGLIILTGIIILLSGHNISYAAISAIGCVAYSALTWACLNSARLLIS